MYNLHKYDGNNSSIGKLNWEECFGIMDMLPVFGDAVVMSFTRQGVKKDEDF